MARLEALGKAEATFKVVEVASWAVDTTTGVDMGANSAASVEDGDESESWMSVPHCHTIRSMLQ